MDNFSTPMMKQYKEIKEQYTDCLLLFRMGDFYELFLDDAHIGAKILNITLTSKPVGKDNRIPMAGVPYHAVDSYINKLVKAGHKVAICEQLSPPNKYGLVERDVIRIITPGTQLSEQALEKKENNFIISVKLNLQNKTLAISTSDISTGYFAVTEMNFSDLEGSLKEYLAKTNPIECILAESEYTNFELLKILNQEKNLNVYLFRNADYYRDNAKKVLKDQFKVTNLSAFDLEQKELSQQVSAILLGYLHETQKSGIAHIKKIESFNPDDYLLLDRSTIINLELFSTIREHDTKGSLLNVLDNTVTAMGGRLLKDWLAKPLKSKSAIEERFNAIDELLKSGNKEELKEQLKQISDIERILSRLATGLGNARDLINFKNALYGVQNIKKMLNDDYKHNLFFQTICKNISPKIENITALLETSINDEPPIDTKIGGILKPNVSAKVDELRKIVNNSKDWIKELEKQERERTGIATLKIRFNKVFGFYIEISKNQAANAPENYLRKQTLVNGERFITKELKEKEELILNAQEKLCDLEFKFFTDICQKVVDQTEILQKASSAIASLDCIYNFATIAEKNNYKRPVLIESGEIKITNGRHPVVEKLLDQNHFVPNDLNLINNDAQLLIITGPNMAGKSVYIRQIAVIVLMSQIGCFIPADEAELSVVDRIFVRSGASDVITSGLSTFMVEMVETAYILHHATENSLIIMDEIGRGTSTYDGISIAWAIADYLVTNFKKPPKTLFATHYHELQELESVFPQKIKNYSMAVTDQNNTPVFLYTVVEKAASHSFGVAVAKLAGVPDEVIKTAEQKLNKLENKIVETDIRVTANLDEQTIFEHLLFKELDGVDIAQMTPLDALNKLAELKEKTKIIKDQTISFLKND